MQSQDEMFDVCDADDRVIGQATRGEVHAHRLLHRAVHCWVVRSDDQLVLQMRSTTKDQYPSTWTSSASGHVDAGETYATAIRREVQEELGLTAPDTMVRLGKRLACNALCDEHTELYLLRTDTALSPDPAEVAYLESHPIADWMKQLHSDPARFSPTIRYLLQEFGGVISSPQ